MFSGAKGTLQSSIVCLDSLQLKDKNKHYLTRVSTTILHLSGSAAWISLILYTEQSLVCFEWIHWNWRSMRKWAEITWTEFYPCISEPALSWYCVCRVLMRTAIGHKYQTYVLFYLKKKKNLLTHGSLNVCLSLKQGEWKRSKIGCFSLTG